MIVDTDHRGGVSGDIVEEEVPEVTVHLRIRLPVAGVARVVVVRDIVETGQVVDSIEIHAQSVLGASSGDVLLELFKFLCGNLERGRERRKKMVNCICKQ